MKRPGRCQSGSKRPPRAYGTSEDEVFGELRVTTTTGFGTLWLAPRLARLFDLYPKLKIDLMLEERLLDLPMREADIAIRMKEPSQADLIRRRLMDVSIKLYASEGYVRKFGQPESEEQLQVHRLITHNPTSPQVRAGAEFVRPFLEQNTNSHLTVNSYFGILEAVRNDLGIGALPDYIPEASGVLVRILPDLESASIPVYLAYNEELRHSKRIAAFRDFVLEEISAYKRSLPPPSHAPAP